MSVKLSINGFGRIGRNILRKLVTLDKFDSCPVVAINDLTSAETLAHLLKYDSIHGHFPGEVSTDGDNLLVNGKSIKISSERDPAKLAWSKLGVDIALECTGIFRSNEQATNHLTAGAKKVLISAPSPDPDFTLAYGVNHEGYKPAEHNIISNASCTTNCLAPVAKVLHENFGIKKGVMTTIHSYTNDQSILDLPHKDLRRARAAALSMIPTTTGAAKAVGLVLPELNGKIDGMAIRVPTSNVSLVDLVANLDKSTTIEEVNRALKNASQNSLAGILRFCDEPLVSIDFVGDSHSSIVDALSTMCIGGNTVKVLAWYDNEMGFSSRMIDVSEYIGSKL
ncbi:MAG: type I glyceraldehyde-3-phosphate dehydrogenase [Bdellovibrionota bacterium]